jgi:hypothetical protein
LRQRVLVQEENAMKKFALLAVAAALLTPALFTAPAAAQDASVSIRVGDPGPRHYHRGYRAYGQERVIVRAGSDCRTTTVRTKRANGTVVIKKIRKCG